MPNQFIFTQNKLRCNSSLIFYINTFDYCKVINFYKIIFPASFETLVNISEIVLKETTLRGRIYKELSMLLGKTFPLLHFFR